MQELETYLQQQRERKNAYNRAYRKTHLEQVRKYYRQYMKNYYRAKNKA